MAAAASNKSIHITCDKKTGTGKLVAKTGTTISHTFDCKAKPGFDYTTDVTIADCQEGKGKWKNYINQDGVTMPYSIGPIQSARGAFIHGWHDLSTSSGCIRISMTDAPILYNWASGRIRILVSA